MTSITSERRGEDASSPAQSAVDLCWPRSSGLSGSSNPDDAFRLPSFEPRHYDLEATLEGRVADNVWPVAAGTTSGRLARVKQKQEEGGMIRLGPTSGLSAGTPVGEKLELDTVTVQPGRTAECHFVVPADF